MAGDGQLPIYLINLDRRPDRLAFMSEQLEALGLSFTRFSAVDAQSVSDEVIAREIDANRAPIRMPRGSQCCTLSHFGVWREIAKGDALGGLVIEDDIELAPAISMLARDIGWVPPTVDIVQLERKGGGSAKLLGPALGVTPDGREIRRLFSRTGGSGAYFIRRETAIRLLADKGLVSLPIDHLLFNANASRLARDMQVAVVNPAVARQDRATFASDITPMRPRRSMRSKIVRGFLEIRLLHRQLWLMLTGAARPVPFTYARDSSGGPTVSNSTGS